jgi:hypothetical protein
MAQPIPLALDWAARAGPPCWEWGEGGRWVRRGGAVRTQESGQEHTGGGERV